MSRLTEQIEHTIKDWDDEILVKAYQDAKVSLYFDEIYLRFSERIYGKCLTFFESSAEAEDCVQEIFMKLLVSIDKFNHKSKFSTWIYSITYNYCIDRIRRKKRNPFDFQDASYKDTEVDNEEREEKILLEMELEELDVVLNAIPTQDKAVLLMKYLDDMSIKDIGQSLGKSESAIKMQLKRAKAKCVQRHNELFKTEKE